MFRKLVSGAIFVLLASVVLSGCSRGSDIMFSNQCSQDVEVKVDGDLLFLRDEWTAISVGATTRPFVLQSRSGAFDVLVRSSEGHSLLSETNVTWAESLTWEPSGFNGGRWTLVLTGDDCSPMLPQEPHVSRIRQWAPFVAAFIVVGTLSLAVASDMLRHRRRKAQLTEGPD